MNAVNRRHAPTKTDWYLCAALGLLMPVMIHYVRMTFMKSYHFRPFEFMPLWGSVNGWTPHLFFRVMQNLGHPAVLIGYSGLMIYLAIKRARLPETERSSTLVMVGMELLHLIFFLSYVGSFLLPLCTMSELIRPG